MGTRLRSVKMMKTAALFLAVIALASAAPDTIVPEGGAAAKLTKHEEFHAQAQKTIALLQEQGTSSDACSSLAATTLKEVEDAVSNLQGIIDGLDDGSSCGNEGQAAVDDATNTKGLADQAVLDAAAALDAAQCTEVDFGTRSFSSLVEGDCAWAYASDEYTAAKAAVAAATTAHNDAVGAAAAAATGLEEAVAEQVRLIHECRCKAKTDYKDAWAAAESGAAERSATYTKAKHMECVLAGTSAADCSVTVPTVTPRTLPEDVSGAIMCGMTPHLAMVLGSTDHSFWYSDSKWSTSDSFDNGASKKTGAFNMKSNCITIKDQGSGNEIHWEHGLDASLKDLFNGHHIDSGIALETWHNWISGAAGQNHCNRQGFQARDDSSWRPVRFGLIMNQENDCGTPDTTIGIGLNTGCQAGAECGCCNNFGSCTNLCSTVEVYVCGGDQTEGDLKIEGGGDSGRLMAFKDGEWGTVCDDHFDTNNHGAIVACKQMGYAGGTYSANYRGTEPDESVVKIVYDDIQCTGTEARIQDCPGFRLHNSDSCSHGEDSGVNCHY